jgi:hypothetical protein
VIQSITPVGSNDVIEALEKALPYTSGQARQIELAQLEAYQNRK